MKTMKAVIKSTCIVFELDRKWLCYISVVALIVIVGGSVGCVSTGDVKRAAPSGATEAGVAQQIERLQSPGADVKADAAQKLAAMGVKAFPAVPHLIALLRDDTFVVGVFKSILDPSASDNAFARNPLFAGKDNVAVASAYPLGEYAARALQQITGRNYGRDATKWEAWWTEHRTAPQH
jgi:hypothetical protein